MKFWRRLDRAILPPSDPKWAWRRRMAFAGCAVQLWAIVYAVAFTPDTARMTSILGFMVPGFAVNLGTYLGIAAVDAHNERETDRKAQAVPVRTEAAVAAQGVKP